MEKEAIKEYTVLRNIEESSLQQKAKAENIVLGDDNNAYFHRTIQGRRSKNRILSVEDSNHNLITDNSLIEEEFLQYYMGP
ncbi:hypothetical protein FRX31_006550 [Thalictrum thalictroides]|uniref:Uncharacterized protein n=1 Tax=Thalictrum thalictroides TaxID=46969 RepID=A0A7J6X3C2_THATH|nr:hypothetical protein FRX31_006550 [Thalictrum thalictroides]